MVWEVLSDEVGVSDDGAVGENVEVTELKPILLGDYYQVSMFLSSLYLFK